jgi:hypothetical protein
MILRKPGVIVNHMLYNRILQITYSESLGCQILKLSAAQFRSRYLVTATQTDGHT